MRDLVRIAPNGHNHAETDFNLTGGAVPLDPDLAPSGEARTADRYREGWGGWKTWAIIGALAFTGLVLAMAALALPTGLHAATPPIKLY